MSKSTILIVVGVILIIIALLDACLIPLDANIMLSKEQLKWQTKEGQYLYVQAHGHRRLLQNFYLGASGLICLTIGLLALPGKNNTQPVKSSN